jgi:PhnB protein
MSVTPYLFFDGRCEEALEFYKKTLGAEVGMLMRFKESPDPIPPGMIPPGSESKIMHAAFKIGSTAVMASDGRAGARFEGSRLHQCQGRDRSPDFQALAEQGCKCRSVRRSLPRASAWLRTASAWAG